MSAALDRIQDFQKQAQLYRKRGDALGKAGWQGDAAKEYEEGLVGLEKCLSILDDLNWKQTPGLAAQRAEVLGSAAGMQRRMERNEKAFELYEAGAVIEREFQLPSTYNRVNELKYSLRTGKKKLRELEPQIRETVKFLEESLSSPKAQELSDSAWAWADLGDCLALLGDLKGADRAYKTFITKADIKSPETTLDILRGIASDLGKNQDPDAARVLEAVSNLSERLTLQQKPSSWRGGS